MTVNEKILQYLEQDRRTQSDLAKQLNIAPPNLFRMLKSNDLKVSQLESICKVLNVPAYYFLDKAPIASDEEVKEYKEKIFELYEKLDTKDKIIEMYDETIKSSVPNVLKVVGKKDYTTREMLEALKELISLNKVIETKEVFNDLLSNFKKVDPK